MFNLFKIKRNNINSQLINTDGKHYRITKVCKNTPLYKFILTFYLPARGVIL